MKLHLPSSLRKALLTCLATLAAHVALPLTVSTGTLITSGALVSFLSAQHALADDDDDEDDEIMAIAAPQNPDVTITDWTGFSDAYTNHNEANQTWLITDAAAGHLADLAGNTATIAANIYFEGENAAITIDDGWSNDGQSGYIFTGSIGGNGNISYSKTTLSHQILQFSGDMSEFSGSISLSGSGNNGDNLLVFNGNTVGSDSARATINLGANTQLQLNDATLNLSSLTAVKLNLAGTNVINLGAASVISGDISGDITGTSFTLGGNLALGNVGAINLFATAASVTKASGAGDIYLQLAATGDITWSQWKAAMEGIEAQFGSDVFAGIGKGGSGQMVLREGNTAPLTTIQWAVCIDGGELLLWDGDWYFEEKLLGAGKFTVQTGSGANSKAVLAKGGRIGTLGFNQWGGRVVLGDDFYVDGGGIVTSDAIYDSNRYRDIISNKEGGANFYLDVADGVTAVATGVTFGDSIHLYKRGNGTQELQRSTKTDANIDSGIAGDVTIEAGTLFINQDGMTFGGDVTIKNGGTLKFKDSSTIFVINGDLTIETGGTMDRGDKALQVKGYFSSAAETLEFYGASNNRNLILEKGGRITGNLMSGWGNCVQLGDDLEIGLGHFQTDKPEQTGNSGWTIQAYETLNTGVDKPFVLYNTGAEQGGSTGNSAITGTFADFFNASPVTKLTISDSVGIGKTGTGRWILTGGGSTAFDIKIKEGTLQFDGSSYTLSGAICGDGTMYVATAGTTEGGQVLHLNGGGSVGLMMLSRWGGEVDLGASFEVGGLQNDATFQDGNGTLASGRFRSINASSKANFSVNVANGKSYTIDHVTFGSDVTLVKKGAGTQTLSDATINGTLNMQAGTMELTGTTSLASLTGSAGVLKLSGGISITSSYNATLTSLELTSGASLNLSAWGSFTLGSLVANGNTITLSELGKQGTLFNFTGSASSGTLTLNLGGFQFNSIGSYRIYSGDIGNLNLNLTGYTVADGFEYSFENGLIRITNASIARPNVLTWQQGDITWVNGVTGWDDGWDYQADSAVSVVFGDDNAATTGDSGTITLGQDISVTGMTIAGNYTLDLGTYTLTLGDGGLTINEGATLTIGASGSLENEAGLTLNGTLELVFANGQTVWSSDTSITAGEHARVVLNSNAASSSYAIVDILGAYRGEVELKGEHTARLTSATKGTNGYAHIYVNAGSHLLMEDDYDCDVSLSGIGISGRTGGGYGAMRMENSATWGYTFNGRILLEDDAAISVFERKTSAIQSQVIGNNHVLFVAGDGEVQFRERNNNRASITGLTGLWSRYLSSDNTGANITISGDLSIVAIAENYGATAQWYADDITASEGYFVFGVDDAGRTIDLQSGSTLSSTGVVSIRKAGDGILKLQGNMGGYGGGALKIDGGTVVLNYTLASGADVADTVKFTSVSLADGTTLSLGKSVAIGSLSGSGSMNNLTGVTGAILTINQSVDATSSAAISGIGITKKGGSTLILTGNYAGNDVTVTEGKLYFTGLSVNITGSVSVSGSYTYANLPADGNYELVNGGSGRTFDISGNVTLTNAGWVIGGVSNDGSYNWDNSVTGTVHGQLQGSGILSLRRGSLTLAGGGDFDGIVEMKDSFTLNVGANLTIGGFHSNWNSAGATTGYQSVNKSGDASSVTVTIDGAGAANELNYAAGEAVKLRFGDGIILKKTGEFTQVFAGIRAQTVNIEEGTLRLVKGNWDTDTTREFWITNLTITKGNGASAAGVLELYKDSWNTNGEMNITLSGGGTVKWSATQTEAVGAFTFGALTLSGTVPDSADGWSSAATDGVFRFNTQADGKTRSVTFSRLTGTGKLDVGTLSGSSATSHYQRLTFTEVNNFNGYVTGSYSGNGIGSDAQYSRVTIGHVSQAAGYNATFAIIGGVFSSDFQKTGEGGLSITKLHVRGGSDGKLYMNYEGSLTITDITLTAGNRFIYTTGETDLTLGIAYTALQSVMTAQGGTAADWTKFTLDLTAVDELLQTSTGIYLGITGVSDSDLTTLKSYFTFHGLSIAEEDWQLVVRDGKLYITAQNVTEVASEWDVNWGSVAGKGPTSMQVVSHPYSGAVDNTSYAHIWQLKAADDDVAQAGQVYLGAGSGGENFIVLGGVYYTDSVNTLSNQPTWIFVADGKYHMLVGGSSCLKFSEDTEAAQAAGGFEADSHIQVTGGTVDYIVGGNHINNSSFTFHGNSYISVMQGATVRGGIVGGSTLTKGSNNSNVYAFQGNTNIFIYTLLGNPDSNYTFKGMWDGTQSAGDDDGTADMYGAAFTAIVGGNAWIDRAVASGGTAMNPTFYGNSNITIDLRNFEDEAGEYIPTFAKDIVGGNYTATVLGSEARSTTFKGKTNIEIYGAYVYELVPGMPEYDMLFNVVFTGAINGASRRASGAAGTTFFTGESTNITITGGDYQNAIAGGFYFEETANGDHGANLNADTTVTLNSGSFWRVVGGSYSLSGGASSSENQTGLSKVVVKGGVFNAAYATGDDIQKKISFIAGGSFYRNNAGINTHTGSSMVVITGGEFGYMDFGIGTTEERDTIHIVGGDYVNFNGVGGNSPSSVITENTTVDISGDGTVIKGVVVGGTYATDLGAGGSATIGGISSVIVKGGTITPESGVNTSTPHDHNGIAVVGGSMLVDEGTAAGGHTLQTANTEVHVTGGSINGHIVGGHYTTNSDGQNTLTVTGSSRIWLEGGTITGNIIGGHFSANTESPDELNLGTVEILLEQGTDSTLTVNGDIIGGSYRTAERPLETSAGDKQNKGAVTITLTSGSLNGDVWAAGYHVNNAAFTAGTTSTEVKIGSGFTFADSHTISGGYGYGYTETSTDKSTVGSAKLTFGDEAAYSNLSNLTFKDFSEINVTNANATVDLSGHAFATEFATLTKTGNGALTLGALSYTGSTQNHKLGLTVSAGTVNLASNVTLGAVSVAGTLNVGAYTLTASSLGGAGTLTLSKGGYISGLTSLTSTTAAKLSITITGLAKDDLADDGYGLFQGGSFNKAWWDLVNVTIDGMSSWGDDVALSYNDDGSISLAKYTDEIVWNGGSAEWSAADTDIEWTNNGVGVSFSNPHLTGEKVNVRFVNEDSSALTVTVSGAVSVDKMTVEGDFTFTGSTAQSLSIGDNLIISSGTTSLDVVTTVGGILDAANGNLTLKKGLVIQGEKDSKVNTLTIERNNYPTNPNLTLGGNLTIGQLNIVESKGPLDVGVYAGRSSSEKITLTINSIASGALTRTGRISAGIDVVFNCDTPFGPNNTGEWTFGGNLSVNGTLTMSGTGTFSVAGTVTATTVNVSSGTVILGNDLAITQVSGGNAVSFKRYGIDENSDLADITVSVAGFSGAATKNMTFGAGVNAKFTTGLTGDAYTGTLTVAEDAVFGATNGLKVGSGGTVSVSGKATVEGATSVNGGSLTVGGDAEFSKAVEVLGGGSLTVNQKLAADNSTVENKVTFSDNVTIGEEASNTSSLVTGVGVGADLASGKTLVVRNGASATIGGALNAASATVTLTQGANLNAPSLTLSKGGSIGTLSGTGGTLELSSGKLTVTATKATLTSLALGGTLELGSNSGANQLTLGSLVVNTGAVLKPTNLDAETALIAFSSTDATLNAELKVDLTALGLEDTLTNAYKVYTFALFSGVTDWDGWEDKLDLSDFEDLELEGWDMSFVDGSLVFKHKEVGDKWVWNGEGDSSWSDADAGDWSQNGNPKDKVVHFVGIDDDQNTATGATITVDDDGVTPAGVVVDEGTYTFTGNGTISASDNVSTNDPESDYHGKWVIGGQPKATADVTLQVGTSGFDFELAENGSLTLDHEDALGDGKIVFTGGTVVYGDAYDSKEEDLSTRFEELGADDTHKAAVKVTMGNADKTWSDANGVTVTLTQGLAVSGKSALTLDWASVDTKGDPYAGDFALGTAVTLTASAADKTLALRGAISGEGDLTLEGDGSYSLSGDALDYAGTLTLSSDTAIAGEKALGGKNTTLVLNGGAVSADAAAKVQAGTVKVASATKLSGQITLTGDLVDGVTKVSLARAGVQPLADEPAALTAAEGSTITLTGDVTAYTAAYNTEADATIDLSAATTDATLANALSGAGTVVVGGDVTKLTGAMTGSVSVKNVGANAVTLAGDGSALTGGSLSGAGGFILDDGAIWGGTAVTGTELTLVSGTLSNGSKLTATDASISAAVAAGAKVDVKGMNGALMNDGITVNANAQLLGVAGKITAGGTGGVEVKLVFGKTATTTTVDGNRPGAAGDYLITGTGSLHVADAEGFILDFSQDKFVEVLLDHRNANTETWLHIYGGGELSFSDDFYDANGNLRADMLGIITEEGSRAQMLSTLGFSISQLVGGDIGLVGNSREVYLVSGSSSVNDAEVNGWEEGLGGYKATVVDSGATLDVYVDDAGEQASFGYTWNADTQLWTAADGSTKTDDELLNDGYVQTQLDGRRNDQLNGGRTVNNLVGLEGSTLHAHNDHYDGTDATRERVVFDNSLVQIDDTSGTPGNTKDRVGGQDTEFDGVIVGDAGVDFVKKGAGTLTVGSVGGSGGLDAQGDVTLTNGGLVVRGTADTADGMNHLGNLVFDYEDGAQEDGFRFTNGSVTKATGILETNTGSGAEIGITEEAQLILTGESDLHDTHITGDGSGSLQVTGQLTFTGDGAADSVLSDVNVSVTDGGSLALNSGAGITGGDITVSGSGSSISVGTGSKLNTDGALTAKDGGLLDLGRSTGNSAGALQGDGVLSSSGGELSITGTGGVFSGTLTGDWNKGGTITVQQGADLTLDNVTTDRNLWNVGVQGNGKLTVDVSSGTNVQLGDITLNGGAALDLAYDPEAGGSLSGNLHVNRTSGQPKAKFTVDVLGIGSRVDELSFDSLFYDGSLDDIDFTLTGVGAQHYAGELTRRANGSLYVAVEKVTENAYRKPALEKNVAAGAELLWDLTDPDSTAFAYAYGPGRGQDLYNLANATALLTLFGTDMSNTFAAVAGSSIATLSSAFDQDLQRQLNTMRNRSTSVGEAAAADQSFSMHAWVNAESGYSKVKAEGYAPGFTLNGWGGTVGLSMDMQDGASIGVALSAMYNDLKASAADSGRGDVDTTWLSAYARVMSGSWSHALIVSLGVADVKLNRTVDYGMGSYRTKGETDGYGLGLMYEVGCSFALNEQASLVLQPIANVQVRYENLDGYTETRSDAGLRVKGMEHKTVTFGLGARLQGALSENAFGRVSFFEARALVKLDAGDVRGTATNALIHGALEQEVESAAVGRAAFELGAGFSLPIGSGSAFFIDAAFELRSHANSLNASAGYRLSF